MAAVAVQRTIRHVYRQPTQSLVLSARNQLKNHGYCLFPSFLDRTECQRVCEQALALETRGFPTAFHSFEDHNILLDDQHPDPVGLPQVSEKILIARDQLPESSTVASLYNWDGLMALVSRVLEEPIQRHGDPLGCAYLNIFRENHSLGWHFDNSPFFVNLILHNADEGVSGQFQYCPVPKDTSPSGLSRIRQVVSDPAAADLIEPQLNPGDILVFRGGQFMHRVSPVVRGVRINAIFTYAHSPGLELNPYTRKRFFGR